MATLSGTTMPLQGMVMMRCIFAMMTPDIEKMITDTNFWVLMMTLLGVGLFIAAFVQKYFFSIIGSKIIINMR